MTGKNRQTGKCVTHCLERLTVAPDVDDIAALIGFTHEDLVT
ncbi:MAG TPA: hypothetical protein VIG47_02990 [Gemmatimonadaceae bacterium]